MLQLEQLPFDVLYSVTNYLDIEDITHLKQSSPQLNQSLREEVLCRRAVQDHAAYTLEAKLSREGKSTYTDTMARIYDRRRRFATASPSSVKTIGHGSAFIYMNGVLCYLAEQCIHIHDVHRAAGVNGALELEIIASVLNLSSVKDLRTGLSLLYYNAGFLSVLYEPSDSESGTRLLIFDIHDLASENGGARCTVQHLSSATRLFVRNTAVYLYYGTHSGIGSHGHHEWIIRGLLLNSTAQLRPIQLEDFVGSDIGSTVAFEIHDGYFFAVSNQTSFEVEEVDWTSFYRCVRFPVGNPGEESLECNDRIYRRQHEEGPINDSWTDLTLQADERTNELMIVEARREWRNGGSAQHRTFYTERIAFPPLAGTSYGPVSSTGLGSGSVASRAPLLPDDPLALLLESNHNAHYAPARTREVDRYHPEYGCPNDPAEPFILARTKVRAYNLSCSAFLDLVECNGSDSGVTSLHIRVGSRRPAPVLPVVGPGEPLGKVQHAVLSPEVELQQAGLETASTQDWFRYEPIRLWPPRGVESTCAQRMQIIMNPLAVYTRDTSRRLNITGVVDERSLVYIVRTAHPRDKKEEMGVIVLISFDSAIPGSFSHSPAAVAKRVDSGTLVIEK